MESMGGEHTWRATCLPLNGLCFLFRMGGAYDFDGVCFRLPVSNEAGKSRSSSTTHGREEQMAAFVAPSADICSCPVCQWPCSASWHSSSLLELEVAMATGNVLAGRRSQPSSSRRLQKPKPSKSFITALRQYSQAATGSAVRRCSARPWHLVLRAVAKRANYGAPGACGLLGWMLLAGTPMLDSGVHLMQYSAYHPAFLFLQTCMECSIPFAVLIVCVFCVLEKEM
jgi:hypothetical protein